MYGQQPDHLKAINTGHAINSSNTRNASVYGVRCAPVSPAMGPASSPATDRGTESRTWDNPGSSGLPGRKEPGEPTPSGREAARAAPPRPSSSFPGGHATGAVSGHRYHAETDRAVTRVLGPSRAARVPPLPAVASQPRRDPPCLSVGPRALAPELRRSADPARRAPPPQGRARPQLDAPVRRSVRRARAGLGSRCWQRHLRW
jgi:hypothetical protein